MHWCHQWWTVWCMGSKTVMVEECIQMKVSLWESTGNETPVDHYYIQHVLWPKFGWNINCPQQLELGMGIVVSKNVEAIDVICAGVIVSWSATNQCASISFSYKCVPQPWCHAVPMPSRSMYLLHILRVASLRVSSFNDTEASMHCHQQTKGLLMWQQQQGEIINHGTTQNTARWLDKSLCCGSEFSFTVCCYDCDCSLLIVSMIDRLKGQLRYKCPALGICLEWMDAVPQNML